MWSHPLQTADLVTFTKEILNGKLHFFVQWVKFEVKLPIGLLIKARNLQLYQQCKFSKKQVFLCDSVCVLQPKNFRELREL